MTAPTLDERINAAARAFLTDPLYLVEMAEDANRARRGLPPASERDGARDCSINGCPNPARRDERLCYSHLTRVSRHGHAFPDIALGDRTGLKQALAERRRRTDAETLLALAEDAIRLVTVPDP